MARIFSKYQTLTQTLLNLESEMHLSKVIPTKQTITLKPQTRRASKDHGLWSRVASMGRLSTQGVFVSLLLQQAEGLHGSSWFIERIGGKRGGRRSLRGMSCSSRLKHSHSPSTAVMAIAPTFTSHLREPTQSA